MFDVVSLGEPLYEFSQIPGADRRYLQGFGGDTMNCAIAAARQGAKVAYLTRLGNDDFGRDFLALWQAEKLDVSGVEIDNAAHTGVYFISHDPSGHRFSYLRKDSAAARMRPAFLSKALLQSTRFFHTSGITQAISASACQSALRAMELARKNGAQVVYDANIRPRLWSQRQARAAVAEALALTDLFLISEEDAKVICGKVSPQPVLDWCHRRGPRTVVLKQGARGAIASEAGRCWPVAVYEVQAVDATAAGDCFAGAAMARLAAGDDIGSALDYASAAAALTCTRLGAVAALPHADAVRALMKTRAGKSPAR
jgi:2-dehydro-3-deoxygluconokinase